MMLGESIVSPETESSKALNIQYPKAIDGDAIVLLGPSDEEQTWVKYGGQWNPFVRGRSNEAFSPKRIIADLTGAFSSPTTVFMPSVGVTTATSVDAGQLALIGLLGFLLLRGAVK
jgi:hypothetical protein